MNANASFLPRWGRGTMRSMVEGGGGPLAAPEA